MLRLSPSFTEERGGEVYVTEGLRVTSLGMTGGLGRSGHLGRDDLFVS